MRSYVLPLIAAALLHAQDGQRVAGPGWPCVPGRAVDPAYLDSSESTGGQLFLFRKNEVEHASIVMSAPRTHPATILRAVGNLNGTRDFEFPVDPGVDSLLFLASLQCREAILVTRPGGPELTAANSALSVDLQAGRILCVDQPEAGRWRLRLTGRGLFVLSVLARGDTAVGAVTFAVQPADGTAEGRTTSTRSPMLGVRQELKVRMAGEVSNVRIQLVDATGERIAELGPAQRTEDGYQTTFTPETERFRILVTGETAAAWPFQRTYPVLFRARAQK